MFISGDILAKVSFSGRLRFVALVSCLVLGAGNLITASVINHVEKSSRVGVALQTGFDVLNVSQSLRDGQACILTYCPTTECPDNNTIQSDGKAPWGVRSTPSLPSLPGPPWRGVVVPERVLSMCRIEMCSI